MSWFAVDDRFWSHRKVMRLRRSEHYADAIALWALAGSWCTGDETSKHTGHVPLDVLAGLGVRDWEFAVQALVGVRLWEETDDPEVVAFHDWDFWNGPNAKTKRLEARREADRVRQQRRRSKALSESGHATTGGSSRDMSRDGSVTVQDGHVPQGKGFGFGFALDSPSVELTSSENPDHAPGEESTHDGTPPKAKDRNAGRDDVRRLCTHLADRIEANGSKRPTVGARWLDAARLLLDVDGRTEAQVMAAIDWCQGHEFWRTNILSMPKLREQYDQLRLKAQAEAARAAAPPARYEPPLPGSSVWDRLITTADLEHA